MNLISIFFIEILVHIKGNCGSVSRGLHLPQGTVGLTESAFRRVYVWTEIYTACKVLMWNQENGGRAEALHHDIFSALQPYL